MQKLDKYAVPPPIRETATAVPAVAKGSSEAPASIPCKAMSEKRRRGNNVPFPQDDPQARTLSISLAAASLPREAMSDGLAPKLREETKRKRKDGRIPLAAPPLGGAAPPAGPHEFVDGGPHCFAPARRDQARG